MDLNISLNFSFNYFSLFPYLLNLEKLVDTSYILYPDNHDWRYVNHTFRTIKMLAWSIICIYHSRYFKKYCWYSQQRYVQKSCPKTASIFGKILYTWLFHSLNPLYLYWSGQPRVFQRLTSFLYIICFPWLIFMFGCFRWVSFPW